MHRSNKWVPIGFRDPLLPLHSTRIDSWRARVSRKFQPTSSNFSGQMIEGVRFVITDRESFDSTRLGIELAVALRNLYPGKIDFDKCKFLIGSHDTVNALAQGKEAIDIYTAAQTEAAKFADRRKQYLLY